MIVLTLAERPDLEDRLDEIGDPWPEFIHHGDVTDVYWDRRGCARRPRVTGSAIS